MKRQKTLIRNTSGDGGFFPKTGKIVDSYKLATKESELHDKKAYPFLISPIRGFFPREDPVTQLPSKFEPVESLLKKMIWYQPDGSPGLLQKFQFADAVKNELPMLDVERIDDTMMQLALYRDYSFLCNAYLLEPCHHSWLKTGDSYGLGRDFLPKNIAVPYVKLSQKLDLKPYLEYNTGYGLNNWVRRDKSVGASMENMDVIRMFIGTKSEAGFVLVHVAINQHSGMLIQSGVNALKAAEDNDRKRFNESLIQMKESMMYMNNELDRMYIESNPKDYNTFRTFIMGITGQPMFPKGVIYEDCFDNQPQYYRGETGANDSIIPFADNILEITKLLPKNPLTEILRDFRTYRPKTHQEFINWAENAADHIGVIEYARKDPLSLLYLIEVADQIRNFRHTHWVLTNLYIMNYSKHPLATGGSPIVRWLPNQLLTVIDYIKKYSKEIDPKGLSSEHQYNLNVLYNRAVTDERIIHRQVEERSKQYKQ